MKKPRICKICGQEFFPDRYHPGQQVCFDPKCQHIRQISNQRSWRTNNPDYFKYKGGTSVWEKRRAQYLKLWRQNHKDYFKNYRAKKSLLASKNNEKQKLDFYS